MFKAWTYSFANSRLDTILAPVVYDASRAKALYHLYKEFGDGDTFIDFCKDIRLKRSELLDQPFPPHVDFDFTLSAHETDTLRKLANISYKKMDATFRKLHRLGLCYYFNAGGVSLRASVLGEAYLQQLEEPNPRLIDRQTSVAKRAITILEKHRNPELSSTLDMDFAKTCGFAVRNKKNVTVLIHCGIRGGYYRNDYNGYTQKKSSAGKYPYNDAINHCMSNGYERGDTLHFA